MFDAPKLMAFWINERERIRIQKENNDPWPWTPDRTLREVRFCNVHREDDKVTRWMRENWSTKDSPVWWFVLGRMLNYIPTLEEVVNKGINGGYDGDRQSQALPSLEGIRDGLKAMRDAGNKIFTSAYTISTCGKRMDKIDYVIGVCGEVQQLEEGFLNDSCFEMWQSLTQVDGLGSFLSAQVVADMKNTQGHSLMDADDWYTFSAPGPGSLRGLNWFFHQKPDGPITAAKYQEAIKQCKSLVDPLVEPYVGIIHYQDFQNCLCEFSKYCNLRFRSGHARNRYVYNPDNRT